MLKSVKMEARPSTTALARLPHVLGPPPEVPLEHPGPRDLKP